MYFLNLLICYIESAMLTLRVCIILTCEVYVQCIMAGFVLANVINLLYYYNYDDNSYNFDCF